MNDALIVNIPAVAAVSAAASAAPGPFWLAVLVGFVSKDFITSL